MIRARAANARRSARSGMTLIEMMIAIMILTVCVGMLTSTITATSAHTMAKREQAVAVEAARSIMEEIYAADFGDIFALYNADPTDDPGGPGTAPGPFFAVEGLSPQDGDLDGFVGEILLPAAGAPLREDAEDELLGLPRDLNGDSTIDKLDHADDYVVMPVRVRVDWSGRNGDRTFAMTTMYCDLSKL